MTKHLLAVAMFVSCIATLSASTLSQRRPRADYDDGLSAKERREMRAAEFAANIDSLISSRDYVFYPITMQNVTRGDTRYVLAYYLFFRMQNDSVAVHLPFEFNNFVIYTENFDSPVEGYAATLNDGLWRVTYSVENEGEKWVVELLVSNVTGQAQLAIATPDATMRYVGTVEPDRSRQPKRKRNSR